MASTAQTSTDFTQDVLGRYICNTLDEAKNSGPFDIIVIGGGSFGPMMAQHLFTQDAKKIHRILILDAGSFVLSQHFQNYPPMGFGPAGPVQNDPGMLRNEVWGLPWRSDIAYTGLAYCLGGRSVFFGGWSPRLLDDEMPASRWPVAVTGDLKASYFDDAARQIGTDTASDFIFGPMHRAMRGQLFNSINADGVSGAIKPTDLPLTMTVPDGVPDAEKPKFKLEAPLAVQARTDPGLFPFNKFSTVPLLIKAARKAASDSGFDDKKKRLMIVPQCHVIRLVTDVRDGIGRVTQIVTNKGNVDVPASGKVVIALGTIESARLALLSFQGVTHYEQIGKGLMAHLRSNLTIQIPRTSLEATHASVDPLDPNIHALQSSALFVKGRHDFGGNRFGYFHQQITAAGLAQPGTDSEAELFKMVPDEDSLAAMRQSDDQTVVITIRGIGETQSGNAGNFIELSTELDEHLVQRAKVHLAVSPGSDDAALWDAMDKCADDIAQAFANGQSFKVLVNGNWVDANPGDDLRIILPYTPGRRDGMGTTHHEAGALAMGDDPNTSVTNANARFHFVENAYVAGPALFPTVGSPNPMLTGVALARRLADRLLTPKYTADAGFTLLFDGVDVSNWRMSTIRNQPGRDNPGVFLLGDGTLTSLPGTDLGLLWHTEPTPPDFALKLEWMLTRPDDNSGVFIRFPNPDSKNYDNTAYVAINFGFEVQIDPLARDDGAAIHKTAAIYGLAGPTDPNNLPVNPPGQWNEFEIRAQGRHYSVRLNGQLVTEYDNPDASRGNDAQTFIGLQTHTGRVAYRKIQIRPL